MSAESSPHGKVWRTSTSQPKDPGPGHPRHAFRKLSSNPGAAPLPPPSINNEMIAHRKILEKDIVTVCYSLQMSVRVKVVSESVLFVPLPHYPLHEGCVSSCQLSHILIRDENPRLLQKFGFWSLSRTWCGEDCRREEDA